jgi:hypothetical protein
MNYWRGGGSAMLDDPEHQLSSWLTNRLHRGAELHHITDLMPKEERR